MSDIREAGGIEQDADGILFADGERQEGGDDPTVDETPEQSVLIRIGRNQNDLSDLDVRMTSHASKTWFVESPRIPLDLSD